MSDANDNRKYRHETLRCVSKRKLFVPDLLLLDKMLTFGTIQNMRLTWFTVSFGIKAKILASPPA